jgi:hypothetical protein
MTIWVLVGASPTGPTLNVQPGIEEFKAGSRGEKPSAPSEPGCFKACALLWVQYTWNQEILHLVTGSDRFPVWLVI